MVDLLFKDGQLSEMSLALELSDILGWELGYRPSLFFKQLTLILICCFCFIVGLLVSFTSLSKLPSGSIMIMSYDIV